MRASLCQGPGRSGCRPVANKNEGSINILKADVGVANTSFSMMSLEFASSAKMNLAKFMHT